MSVWLLRSEKAWYIPVSGFVTEEYLLGMVKNFFQKELLVGTPDIKSLRKKVGYYLRKGIFDLTIAAYLLNPLKSEYSYDDVAKEYLGEQFPSREEIFGSGKHIDLSMEEQEKVAQYGAYQAYVSLRAQKPMTKALEEMGMRELFEEIEMPLAFTLDDMEKEGILVQAQELKDYGEKFADTYSGTGRKDL